MLFSLNDSLQNSHLKTADNLPTLFYNLYVVCCSYLYFVVFYQVALQVVFEGIINKMKEVDDVSRTVFVAG